MANVAYLDCFSGIAGDMGLAALIDAGLSKQDLVRGLKSIKKIASEWSLDVNKVRKGHGLIAATYVKVISTHGDCGKSDYSLRTVGVPQDERTPIVSQVSVNGHYQNQNYKQTHGHSHSHSHSHGHTHTHRHGHKNLHVPQTIVGDNHHGLPTKFRNFPEIQGLIQESQLPSIVKEKSILTFKYLAQAEARVHGVDISEIHFHEVGAIDSIIDTVGVILGLHLLNVDLETGVYCSPVPYSTGYVNTSHGILPCPAPATLHLLKNLPCIPAPPGAFGELVTPTGASLLKALCLPNRVGPPPAFIPKLIGHGCGKKEFSGHPNMLRITIGSRYSVTSATRNRIKSQSKADISSQQSVKQKFNMPTSSEEVGRNHSVRSSSQRNPHSSICHSPEDTCGEKGRQLPLSGSSDPFNWKTIVSNKKWLHRNCNADVDYKIPQQIPRENLDLEAPNLFNQSLKAYEADVSNLKPSNQDLKNLEHNSTKNETVNNLHKLSEQDTGVDEFESPSLMTGEGSAKNNQATTGIGTRNDLKNFNTALKTEKLVTLETNIDDLSPEVIAYAGQQLLAAGALDVWVTPIQVCLLLIFAGSILLGEK